MGKKARKTRWRTLEITDEQSDSEETHATTSPRLPKSLHQKSYYGKLAYSSQSTPRRKYQYDSTKSTRSSSTASENKITFNEEEYTRITTPRQDVLFKKGYLSKPKNFQTQTSTGTSTTSASNSTGNGTPDHQSTDLEYDSQFVFPNGFVDQNGIYYVNSFEPYPLMLYNPPTYYTEFSNSKSKRYSTGSLTESTSPNNEEATSQDLSGGEASNNVSDYSSHHSVYNMVYPGYYINGVCPPQDMENGHYLVGETRKLKKRRRRKTSRSQTNNQDESTECSEDEDLQPVYDVAVEFQKSTFSPAPDEINHPVKEEKLQVEEQDEIDTENPQQSAISAVDNKLSEESKGCREPPKTLKYNLKPDAEEFVPRAYRTPEIPLSPVQFIKVPPNFVPIPIVPYNGQINPAFIPPGGIPINFIPPDPKLFPPNFTNFIPGHLNNEETFEKHEEIKKVMTNDQNEKVCDTNSNTAKDESSNKIDKTPEKMVTNPKTIDIATIVSKLEEAAKEQEEHEEDTKKSPNSELSPNKKPYKTNQKYRNHYKRNFFNSPRQSPQRQNGDVTVSSEIKHIVNDSQTDTQFSRNTSERFRKNWKTGSAKWQNNGIQRSPKQHQRLHTEPQKFVKHYSETLKTIPMIKKPEPEIEKTVSVPSSPKPTSNKVPDEWISVSSRKKRKNKNNVEESDASIEDTTPTAIEEDEVDEFETYDVNMLVDVIPPSKTEEETSKDEVIEEKVEQIINTIAQNECVNIQNNNITPDIRSVTDIENELIVKQESPKQEIEILPEIQNEIEIITNVEGESKSSKKKPKKGSQKSVIKRVIITDVDMSDKCEEIKTPTKKVLKKIDKPKDTTESNKIEEVDNNANVESVTTTVKEPEEDKKKNKKKKKKVTKANSLTSSTTTLNLAEDTYNLLLDTNLATEADKTNDEISVELDKMIQKGIYSSLEEKMKSMNLSESDGFFKSVLSKVPIAGRTETAGFLKSPDFTKIPLFKSDPVSEEHNLESKKINDELPPSESPENFLDKPVTQAEEPKSLYPITEAVKEWMCRTRETTPDVEIFKSPRTIYKEFGVSDTKNNDYELCNSRNLSDEFSASVDEDEITLFTTEDADKTVDGSNEDLLEYWEDLKSDSSQMDTNQLVEKNEDEAELEIYESKYGTNEDFIKLQKEVKEKSKNINYPTHGNLPYRAICCSVM